MSLQDTIDRGRFWDSINEAWASVVGLAGARTAVLSTDPIVRDKAAQDLDRLFGQAFEELVANLALLGIGQLAMWGVYWDAAFTECWGAIDDSEKARHSEDNRLRFFCTFIVMAGRTAVEAFCERPHDYLGYSPAAVYEYDAVSVVFIAQRQQQARLLRASLANTDEPLDQDDAKEAASDGDADGQHQDDDTEGHGQAEDAGEGEDECVVDKRAWAKDTNKQ